MLGRLAVALMVASSLSGGVASAQPMTAAERARAAETKLEEGIHLLTTGDPEGALRVLDESYRLRASSRVRLYRGRALARLERYGEAYRELGEAVEEADEEIDAQEGDDPRLLTVLEAAAREQRALESRIAWLTLDVVAPVVPILHVQGRRVSAADIGEPVAVTPGTVEVDVTCTECDPLGASFEVGVGERRRLQLILDDASMARVAPPPDGIGVRDVFGWSTIGIGTAAAIAWVVLISMAEQKRNDGDMAGADDLDAASYGAIATAGVMLTTGLALLLWEALDD